MIWLSAASKYPPMALGLLFLLGHNPRLGGTFLAWGAQAVIWERTWPRNAPPWCRASLVGLVTLVHSKHSRRGRRSRLSRYGKQVQ